MSILKSPQGLVPLTPLHQQDCGNRSPRHDPNGPDELQSTGGVRDGRHNRARLWLLVRLAGAGPREPAAPWLTTADGWFRPVEALRVNATQPGWCGKLPFNARRSAYGDIPDVTNARSLWGFIANAGHSRHHPLSIAMVISWQARFRRQGAAPTPIASRNMFTWAVRRAGATHAPVFAPRQLGPASFPRRPCLYLPRPRPYPGPPPGLNHMCAWT